MEKKEEIQLEPFRLDEDYLDVYRGNDFIFSLGFSKRYTEELQRENARCIVKYCNNHYQLLEALKGLIEALKYEGLSTFVDPAIDKAEEAIKKAEA